MTFAIILAPFIAAILALALPGLPARLRRALSLLGVIVSLVLTFQLWSRFAVHGAAGLQDVSGVSHWFTLPNLLYSHNTVVSLTFGVDGLSLPLLTLALVVALLALVSGSPERARAREYEFWFGLAITGVVGVLTANDVFTFILALELSLFASFFLLYLFGQPNLRRRAAFKFLIYRGLASVALIAGLVGVAYVSAVGQVGGSTSAALTSGHGLVLNISSLLQSAATAVHGTSAAWRGAVFLMLLLGVLIEEAFVPFHTWLPEAHQAADTPVNILLGGILTKTGAYVLLRFGVAMMPDEVHHYGHFIAILGVLNILYGAFAAWGASGWRRLIAFGSISHMGLVLLGIAAMNAAGLQGAMFMLISSGLLTAFLFYATGALENRQIPLQLAKLGGLSKSMPLLSGFLLFAALGSLGLPLTSGFISEVQAFMGGFGTFPAISFVGLGGLILSACYLLYAIQKTTFGPVNKDLPDTLLMDIHLAEWIPLALLTGAVLLIGIYPHVLDQFFHQSITTMLGIGG